MNRNFGLLQALCTMLMVTSAYAGYGVGNGGNAVVCYNPKGQITSVELFDYWEMERVLASTASLDLGDVGLPVKEKLDKVFKRIEKFDPSRGSDLRAVAYNLANNIDEYLVEKLEIVTIDDDSPRILPSLPCKKEQFAVQIKEPRSGEKPFLISKRLFDESNNDTRAGIILHEAIYRLAILNEGQTTSDNSRYFNFMVSSDYLNARDFAAYDSVLASSSFSYGEIYPYYTSNRKFPLFISRSSSRSWGDGQIHYAVIAAKTVIDTEDLYIEMYPGTIVDFTVDGELESILSPEGKQTYVGYLKFPQLGLELPLAPEYYGYNYFDKGLKPQFMRTRQSFAIQGPLQTFNIIGSEDLRGGLLEIKDGQILSVYGHNYSKDWDLLTPVSIQGKTYLAGGKIGFFPDYRIKSFSFRENNQLHVRNSKTLFNFSWVNFNIFGDVVEGALVNKIQKSFFNQNYTIWMIKEKSSGSKTYSYMEGEAHIQTVQKGGMNVIAKDFNKLCQSFFNADRSENAYFSDIEIPGELQVFNSDSGLVETVYGGSAKIVKSVKSVKCVKEFDII